MIKEVDLDENGTIEFGEFIEVTTRDVLERGGGGGGGG